MSSGIGTEQVFKGIAAAPGVSFGTVFVHIENDLYVPHYSVDLEDLDGEVKRFELALLTAARHPYR